MGDEPKQEQRSCLLNGCPNVEHVKNYITGSEKVLNKRIDGMKSFLITVAVVLLTFTGTYSLWSSDKKDIQNDKVSKIEEDIKHHDEAWVQQREVNNKLLQAIENFNESVIPFMSETRTKMEIYHPNR